MSYKTVKATCRSCNGLGWYESSEWTSGDRGWSDYHTNRYYGCGSCGGSGNEMEIDKIKKGSGKESVKIKTIGGICSSCDGKGKTTSRWREEGSDSRGREYRKDFDRTDSCSSCFGTGEKCAEVSSKKCDKCNGGGGFYYWEKSSFSSKEYKKERKCEQCNGVGRIENLVGDWSENTETSPSMGSIHSNKPTSDSSANTSNWIRVSNAIENSALYQIVAYFLCSAALIALTYILTTKFGSHGKVDAGNKHFIIIGVFISATLWGYCFRDDLKKRDYEEILALLPIIFLTTLFICCIVVLMSYPFYGK